MSTGECWIDYIRLSGWHRRGQCRRYRRYNRRQSRSPSPPKRVKPAERQEPEARRLGSGGDARLHVAVVQGKRPGAVAVEESDPNTVRVCGIGARTEDREAIEGRAISLGILVTIGWRAWVRIVAAPQGESWSFGAGRAFGDRTGVLWQRQILARPGDEHREGNEREESEDLYDAASHLHPGVTLPESGGGAQPLQEVPSVLTKRTRAL